MTTPATQPSRLWLTWTLTLLAIAGFSTTAILKHEPSLHVLSVILLTNQALYVRDTRAQSPGGDATEQPVTESPEERKQ
jgi:hypothetical protein